MIKRLVSTVLVLALSDLLIIAFNKLLAFYEKRQNHFREEENMIAIKYPESFKKRTKIAIVICIIIGAFMGLYTPGGKATLLDLFIKQASYGIGFLSFYAMFITIVGKIKRLYCSIKFEDPQFYLRDIPDVEVRKEKIKNPFFEDRSEDS